MAQNKKEYDDEPVFYCKTCLSLKIREMNERDYCDSCGSTEIEQTDIETWITMYKNMYGEDSVLESNYLKEFMQ